jgi:hypothetical protein
MTVRQRTILSALNLRETPMFNNNETALAAVRDAVDALREAIEALKKERDEAIVNERVVAQIKEVKERIQRQRAHHELATDMFFWMVKERRAFRGETEWPSPSTPKEIGTRETLDHYRRENTEYTWERLAGSTLDSDSGLDTVTRNIARKIMISRGEYLCDEASALTPFYC